MDGLLVKETHARNIVHNGKRIEVRSRAHKKFGQRIAIVEVTDDQWRIVAYATLARCFRLTPELAAAHASIIQAPGFDKRYKDPHAWELEHVSVLSQPVQMDKKRGPVVWVRCAHDEARSAHP